MRLKIILFFFFIHFSSFGQNIAEEEVCAHISKNITAVGDEIWFYLQVNSYRSPGHSKMAYVELVDRKNLPVFQSIIPLEQGKAEGTIKIPSSLQSDNYLLRFYTRTSPIFSQNGKGVFNKFITIINPKKGPSRIQNFPSLKNYTFENPGVFMNQKSRVNKQSEIPIQLDFIQDTFNISVSIKNPFLNPDLQGSIGQEIYQPLKNPKIIPELFGHIVHGKNLAAQIDTAETFFLSAHGKQSVLHAAKPDKGGNLFFDLGPLKAYDFLIAQSYQHEKQLNFEPQSPFLPFLFEEDFNFPPLELNEKDREFLEKILLSAQLIPHFYPSESFFASPIVTGFVADRTYYLDDFTRFENLETTLREYVPEVLVRKQSRTTIFKLINAPLNALFQDNPLILIDAMPVFDTEKLANFDPKGIQKLEVLNREFSFNQDKFSGVLSLTSFDNDFGKIELPINSLYLNYWELMPKWKLKTPHFNPHLDEANYPDFRSSLFWSTEQLKNAFSIKASSISGDFEIIISYPDKDGNLNFKVALLQVMD
ncbi:hypothetical protein [Cecembia sp.]|uniref:hypothetical protein n=1 Tax=Cecembia sp. TaxID=1898110 RepID=UPI0025BEC984|nr:hypothetical protein [Cecembia sp.]